MTVNPENFKSSPKRFHPKGLEILYEDRDILVADKACGLLTVANEKVRENTAYFLLNNYVRKGNSKSKHRIFIVHRLDRDVSGVIVFAKTHKAKEYLQETWTHFKKIYYVVVQGHLKKKEGIISSYIEENKFHRMASVDDPRKGKLAKTAYKVIKESRDYSLLEINLLSGRKNQIRVHLSEQGCPVVGDKKYGAKGKGIKRLALHSSMLTIRHPHSKEKKVFKVPMPLYFKTLVRDKDEKKKNRSEKIKEDR